MEYIGINECLCDGTFLCSVCQEENKMKTSHNTVQEYVDACLNNWAKWPDFGLSDRDSYLGWTIVYTHNRDSNLLDKVNATVIAQAMDKFEETECREFSANHWACGWVKGFAIRVYGDDGNITTAFAAWVKFQEAMLDYPVLDEDSYSQAEYDMACEICEQEGWDVNDNDAFEKARTMANE